MLLADGHPWASIVAVLYTSSRTIARWQRRFPEGRVEALRGRRRGAPRRLGHRWMAVVLHGVLNHGKRTSNDWQTKELGQVTNVPARTLALDFQRPLGGIATQERYSPTVQQRHVGGSRTLI